MDINYERLEWEDFPSTETPINADNLNHLEEGIAGLYAERYEMQSNIAYVEDGETASKDYLPNSYLMRDGLFYKVTKTILYGDSFDSGEDGNIEHVDISSQFGSGGGGSTGCVELTQAQYDALSDDAKMLDVIYLITDSPDNYLDEVFGDFATVEYTDTASKAYAVGEYLVYDSKFYKVTSAIEQGATIVPDTNVDEAKVGEELTKRIPWTVGYYPSNKDFNTFPVNSTYHVAGTGYEHSPEPSGTCYGVVKTFSGGGNYIIQTAYLLANGAIKRISSRTFADNAWSAWIEAFEDTGILNAGSGFGGTVYYRRRNGIVNVFMNYAKLTGLTVSKDNIVGTLPAGFRPYANSAVHRTVNNEGFSYVGGNGNVYVHPTATSIWEGFSFTYIPAG